MIGGPLVTVSDISPPLGFRGYFGSSSVTSRIAAGFANSVHRGLTVEIERTLLSWTHSSQVLGAFQSADFFSKG
jgi:hypothetical protein